MSQLSSVLSDVSSEVIVVDDSDDDTPAVMERAAASNHLRLRVIHREPWQRDGGLSTAVIEGLTAARGRYVLVMDADLQHPTELIVTMLKRAEEASADIVIASRYVKGGSDAGLASRSRKLISWGARWLVTVMFYDRLRKVHDPLSGFFLARREVVNNASLRAIGFKILLDVLVRCRYSRVSEVPLRFASRSGGVSKATFAQGRDFLMHAASLFWDTRVRRLLGGRG